MPDLKFKIVVLAFSALLFSIFILVGMYPYHPNGYVGWLVLYVVSLPLVIILEILGDKLFNQKILNNIGLIVRIIYGVVALGIFLLLSSSSLLWLMPYFEKWGS